MEGAVAIVLCGTLMLKRKCAIYSPTQTVEAMTIGFSSKNIVLVIVEILKTNQHRGYK